MISLVLLLGLINESMAKSYYRTCKDPPTVSLSMMAVYIIIAIYLLNTPKDPEPLHPPGQDALQRVVKAIHGGVLRNPQTTESRYCKFPTFGTKVSGKS